MTIFSLFLSVIAALIFQTQSLPVTREVSAQPLFDGDWFGFYISKDRKTYSPARLNLRFHNNSVDASVDFPRIKGLATVTVAGAIVKTAPMPASTQFEFGRYGAVKLRYVGNSPDHILIYADDGEDLGTFSFLRREVKDIDLPAFYQLAEPRGYGGDRPVKTTWNGVSITGKLFDPKVPRRAEPRQVIVMVPCGPRASTVDERTVDLLLISSLCRAGFSVLTFDDLGTGSNAGDKAALTISDSADQCISFAEVMRQLEHDNGEPCVGYLGIGEGACVAACAAYRDKESHSLAYICGPHNLECTLDHSWLGDEVKYLSAGETDTRRAVSLLRTMAEASIMQPQVDSTEAGAKYTAECRLQNIGRKIREDELYAYLSLLFTKMRHSRREASLFLNDYDAIVRGLSSHGVAVLVISGRADADFPTKSYSLAQYALASLKGVVWRDLDITERLTDYGTMLSDHPIDPVQLVSPALIDVVVDFHRRIVRSASTNPAPR